MGSPPRMRGKQKARKNIALQLGITPADAGKTPTGSLLFFPPRDHPRGCGENDKLGGEAFDTLGSPPRMRGKLRHGSGLPPMGGITPADAGKTGFLFPPPEAGRDHPRGCGENTKKIL